MTAYNVVYFHTLKEAAWLEAQLGNQVEATALEAEAARSAAAINAHLWNAELGLYDISDQRVGQFAEDANTMAVLWGVAPAEQRTGILDRIKDELWIPAGVQPFSDNAAGFQLDVLTPFATGFETAARFAESDTADALDLMRRHWGLQVDPTTPDYVGSLWEKVSTDGTAVVDDGSNPIDNNSLAHGWSSAPTSQLSEYVLGIKPIGPGYSQYTIAPAIDSVQWAQGRVPSAQGPIEVQWRRTGGGTLQLSAETPADAEGTISVPVTAGSRVTIKTPAGTQRFDVTEARDLAVDATGGTYSIIVRPGR